MICFTSVLDGYLNIETEDPLGEALCKKTNNSIVLCCFRRTTCSQVSKFIIDKIFQTPLSQFILFSNLPLGMIRDLLVLYCTWN